MIEKEGRWNAFTTFLDDGRICLKRFDLLLRHDNKSKRAEPINGVGVSKSSCEST